MRTIAHVSDLHFGAEDPAVAEGLLRDLDHLGPSLVAISGDLTQRAKRREFEAARAYLDRIPFPVLTVPGNHDVPLYDLASRALRPLARYKRIVSDDLNPVFSDGEMVVLGLNTARAMTWKNGRVSEAQIERIRARLRLHQHEVGFFKVLVSHHPLVPVGAMPSHSLAMRGELALGALAEWGADLMLAGHLHQGFTGAVESHPVPGRTRRSILVAQAGTSISLRHRGEPNAWNLITIDPPRVSIEVRVWDEGRFRSSTITRYHHDRFGSWAPAGAESIGLRGADPPGPL